MFAWTLASGAAGDIARAMRTGGLAGLAGSDAEGAPSVLIDAHLAKQLDVSVAA